MNNIKLLSLHTHTFDEFSFFPTKTNWICFLEILIVSVDFILFYKTFAKL